MSLEFRTLLEIQLGQTFMHSNYVTNNVTRLRCEVLCMHVVRTNVWGHRLNVAFKKDEHLIVLSRQYITFNASIYQYNDFIAKSEKISRTDDLKLVLQQTKTRVMHTSFISTCLIIKSHLTVRTFQGMLRLHPHVIF